MRLTGIARILTALVLVAATGLAGAADPPGVTRVHGKVVSLDNATRTLVVKLDKTGEEVSVFMPEDDMYHTYSKGAKEDLKTGEHVKVYGGVAKDLSAVHNCNSICIMPIQSTHTDRKSRLDGTLVVEGDNYFVMHKEYKVPLKMREKWQVVKVFDSGYDFLHPGLKMNFGVVEKDGKLVPRSDVRSYAPREEVEKHLANRKKD